MACNLKFHTWAAWINRECLKFQQMQKNEETGLERVTVCQDTMAALISRKRKKYKIQKELDFLTQA